MLTLNWNAEFAGASPYANDPVVVATVNVTAEDWTAYVQACSRLREEFPLWFARQSSEALEGAGRVGETLAIWSRAALNEARGCIEAAGYAVTGDTVRVWLGHHRPQVSRAALALGVATLTRLVHGEPLVRTYSDLERLWQHCRAQHPDYQAAILIRAARARGIPWLPAMEQSRLWQFGWGVRGRVFFESSGNGGGALAMGWQGNKVLSKQLMASIGLPTPPWAVIAAGGDVAKAVAQVGFPCVVKPLDRGGGKGVTAGLGNVPDVETAVAYARRFTRNSVMVEAYVAGDDHRIMVMRGKAACVIRRRPPVICGDGVQSIRALIAAMNRARQGGLMRARYHRPVPLDAAVEQTLATQGYTLDDVVPKAVEVILRGNANLSTGGRCDDVTAQTHPQVIEMAEHLADLFGLEVAGLDYLTPDISLPPADGNGAFIEINATPGLEAAVVAGWSEAAIGELALGPEPASIPVDLRVLPAALTAHVADEEARTLPAGCALAFESRLWIGGLTLNCAEPGAYPAVQAALRHRRVERLTIVCSDDALRRHGVPVRPLASAQIEGVALHQAWARALHHSIERTHV